MYRNERTREWHRKALASWEGTAAARKMGAAMKRILPAVTAFTLLSAMNANSQSSPSVPGRILPFDAVERSLPNGLKVIVVPTGFPNLVSVQIPVQTGSRNEFEPGKSGFAHFFEHMMFRGTKSYPPDAYQTILTKAGAGRQGACTAAAGAGGG